MKHSLIIALCLLSCGTLQRKTVVKEHLSISINDFEEYMEVEVEADILVKRKEFFEDYRDEKYEGKDVDVVAVCSVNTNEIIFNEEVVGNLIEKADKPQYELLPIVYHELGHCMFDLDHDDTETFADIPATWMHPVYQEKWKWDVLGYDYYKREFKTRALK